MLSTILHTLYDALPGLFIGYMTALFMCSAMETFRIRTALAIPLSAYAWALLIVYMVASYWARALGTIGPDMEPVRAVADGERWRVFSGFVNKHEFTALAGVGIQHLVEKRKRDRKQRIQ